MCSGSIFIDENQDVYRRATQLPVTTPPMVLDRNCRNTGHIHAAAYRFYRGDTVEAPEIEGTRIETLVAGDLAKQARAIAGTVTRLISTERVAPHDIAVLLCAGAAKAEAEAALAAHAIPRGVAWGRLESYGKGVVTVDTVARFKGLERAIVILWIGGCDPREQRETFYVGLSRAKSVVILCGTQDDCRKVVE